MGVDPGGTNQLKVLAPRSGVVLDVGAATGELSESLDAPQPLCTIADLSTIWVEGEIQEQDLKGLKSGAAAQVHDHRVSRGEMDRPRVGGGRCGGPNDADFEGPGRNGQSSVAIEARYVRNVALAAFLIPG